MRPSTVLSAAMLAAGAILASPAAAQGAAPGIDANAEAAAAPDEKSSDIVVDGELSKKQKRVCMSETATGSIMSRRVCYTVAQLEERKRIAEHVKNELGKEQASERHLQEARRNGR